MSAERQKPGVRAAYAEFRTLSTRWSDNDVYGHMNNVVHYALFDTAVNGFLMEKGVLDPHAGESFFVVAETGCRYHGEIAFPDRVTAGLRVARLGTASIRYEIALFRNDDDHAAAEGVFVHVHIDRQNRRPRPIPPPVRTLLEPLTMVAA